MMNIFKRVLNSNATKEEDILEVVDNLVLGKLKLAE